MNTPLHNVKILVTGISGFIGSHLARRLVKEGALVAGIARKNSNLCKIKDIQNQVQLYSADLKDSGLIEKLMQRIQPQKIFHLAAYVDVSRSFEVMDKIQKIQVFKNRGSK